MIRTVVGVVVLLATVAGAWEDRTGDKDMPWLGRGGRARWFYDQKACFMCPTGYTIETRWGRSAWFAADVYDTVQVAMRYLERKGPLATWPAAIGEGSVGGTGDADVVVPRAAPYRFTIVMLEPTVVVMRFDLGALVKLGAPANGQEMGTPRLGQSVEYGTRVPATGTLLWFSPDADQPPTPVALSDADHGEIVVRDVRLDLTRDGDAWSVRRR